MPATGENKLAEVVDFSYSSQTQIGLRGPFVPQDLPQKFRACHWKGLRSLFMTASFREYRGYAFWCWPYTACYINTDQDGKYTEKCNFPLSLYFQLWQTNTAVRLGIPTYPFVCPSTLDQLKMACNSFFSLSPVYFYLKGIAVYMFFLDSPWKVRTELWLSSYICSLFPFPLAFCSLNDNPVFIFH